MLRSRAIFNAMRAAYPDERVEWRRVWGAYVAAVGLKNVVPAGGANVVQIFLTKSSIERSTFPTVTSAITVGAIFDAVVSVLTPYAWMGGPGIVHTAAAKGGVLNMTRTLGVEWAGRGVRVNAVAPGWMLVGGTQAMAGTPESKARLLAGVPAGRFLEPEECARAVAYLLSDDAAYVTGICLPIDGGHHLSKGLFEFVVSDGKVTALKQIDPSGEYTFARK